MAGFSTTRQVLVGGVDEVVEAGRHGHAVLGEPGLVVVQAHVAVVDRRDPVLGVEAERLVDLVEALRLVGHEEVGVEGPGQERRVDAEEHVGLRVAVGEDGLVHDLAGVAALDQLDLDARLLGELRRAPRR